MKWAFKISESELTVPKVPHTYIYTHLLKIIQTIFALHQILLCVINKHLTLSFNKICFF